MKYDDLLTVPFRWGGRDKSGMDCFGIVVECCRRAGTPIKDPFRELDASVSYEEAERVRREAINMEETDGPAVGRIIYAEMGGKSHVGYIVERGKVLHAIEDGLPRVTPLRAFRNPIYFEVTSRESAAGALPADG